ncbi:MAG: hypothetical protein ACK5T0_02240, partial [Vampirovibrionales bacterium]
MRISPTLPSVRPSNQMTAQSATQASPSSPSQNARSGKLLFETFPENGLERISTELPVEGLIAELTKYFMTHPALQFSEDLWSPHNEHIGTKKVLNLQIWNKLQLCVKQADDKLNRHVIIRQENPAESAMSLILSRKGKETPLLK